MHNLRIEIMLKDHPYRTAPGAYLEAWGIMSVNIHDGANVIRLAQIERDVLSLVEWFVQNRSVIATEDFFMLGEKANPGESISEALHRIGVQRFSLPFQKPDNVIEQEMADYDAHYLRHSPHRDMIGSGMPEILIGLNNSLGELSLLNEAENWRYEFDMDSFLRDFSIEISRFISEWLAMTENSEAQKRGAKMMKGL